MITALQLLLLLPVVLTAHWLVRPMPSALESAPGVMRYCLGFAKWALLAEPMGQLVRVVYDGGAESVSTGTAWMGFLAYGLTVHFLCTGLDDLVTGLAGMLGLKTPKKLRDVLSFHAFTQGRPSRFLLVVLMITIAGVMLKSSSHGDAGLFLMPLVVSSPAGTVAAVFQQTRALADFHVITIVAGLVCAAGMPRTDVFLQQPQLWKGVLSLSLFALSVAMLWTKGAQS